MLIWSIRIYTIGRASCGNPISKLLPTVLRKPTLHERDPGTVNHVLHLLMTLLCCLMWLPIWMLLTLTQPKRRVRCLTCGLAIGDHTIEREEAADAEAKKITDRRDAKIEQAEIRREKAEAEAKARANALAVKAAAKAAAAPAANDSTAEAKEEWSPNASPKVRGGHCDTDG